MVGKTNPVVHLQGLWLVQSGETLGKGEGGNIWPDKYSWTWAEQPTGSGPHKRMLVQKDKHPSWLQSKHSAERQLIGSSERTAVARLISFHHMSQSQQGKS